MQHTTYSKKVIYNYLTNFKVFFRLKLVKNTGSPLVLTHRLQETGIISDGIKKRYEELKGRMKNMIAVRVQKRPKKRSLHGERVFSSPGIEQENSDFINLAEKYNEPEEQWPKILKNFKKLIDDGEDANTYFWNSSHAKRNYPKGLWRSKFAKTGSHVANIPPGSD